MASDLTGLAATCGAVWEHDITPTLQEYVRIPNVSPAFDAGWADAGHMDDAVALARQWCEGRPVDGLSAEVVRLPGRTPVLLVEVPATVEGAGTVLLYGHLDKQPPMTEGWRTGRGPWEPVIEDGRLYGRGGADDGYATFAATTAIEAVQAAGLAHARCIVLIECSEESGSPDLPAHVDHLADRIGRPELVVCLDSGCASYDRLWCTTSLRGMLTARLRVDVLTEGVHSGSASGAVPGSFRLLRQILDRLEDSGTGRVLVPELWVDVPPGRRQEAVDVTGDGLGDPAFPYVDGVRPARDTPLQRLLARTWEPTLTTIGAGGLPPWGESGNVLRPWTEVVLSFRLPPTCPAGAAADALTATAEAQPPDGARVGFDVVEAATGWNAPPTEPWLRTALDHASTELWGRPARSIGEGGSIPFMAMLGERFPDAQFLVTGVLGPGSNAHGPNEFLDLATGRRVTATVAHVLAAHADRARC